MGPLTYVLHLHASAHGHALYQHVIEHGPLFKADFNTYFMTNNFSVNGLHAFLIFSMIHTDAQTYTTTLAIHTDHILLTNQLLLNQH